MSHLVINTISKFNFSFRLVDLSSKIAALESELCFYRSKVDSKFCTKRCHPIYKMPPWTEEMCEIWRPFCSKLQICNLFWKFYVQYHLLQIWAHQRQVRPHMNLFDSLTILELKWAHLEHTLAKLTILKSHYLEPS